MLTATILCTPACCVPAAWGTDFDAGQPAGGKLFYRLSYADLAAHISWQNDMSNTLPAGSLFRCVACACLGGGHAGRMLMALDYHHCQWPRWQAAAVDHGGECRCTLSVWPVLVLVPRCKDPRLPWHCGNPIPVNRSLVGFLP
jgi:hypothetical protein